MLYSLLLRNPILILLALAISSFVTPRLFAEEPAPSLTFLQSYDIRDEPAGLLEPSGAALCQDGKSLWTISDKTKRIYRLDLTGKIEQHKHFQNVPKGLEGICLSSDGNSLFTVDEDNNRILKFDIESGERIATIKLSDIAGYKAIEGYFDASIKNKGLEGITLNCQAGSLLVVKEGKPGLLIEVSEDLKQIRGHLLLNEESGFIDDNLEQARMDFSGLWYDERRDSLWIVSDQARRLFWLDLGTKKVRHSYALSYARKGKYREIDQAEGITHDPETHRLYIISDREAKLYVYDLR